MNRIIKKDMLADLTSTYTMLQEIKRPTPRGNWPGQLAGRTEEEKKKKKKKKKKKSPRPHTSRRGQLATTSPTPPEGGREGPPPQPHIPPLQQPGPAGSTDGERKCPQIEPRIGLTLSDS